MNERIRELIDDLADEVARVELLSTTERDRVSELLEQVATGEIA